MLKSWRVASARPRPDGGALPDPADRPARVRALELLNALLDGFEQNDLLTYASAISFQILTAIVPFLLFVLAVAGLLHLDDVWRLHLEPQIRAHVSEAVFAVIANAARTVLGGRRVLWATIGGALALWQVSGAVRAVMGALGRIYGSTVQRPFRRRYSISFVLSMETGACFVLATACGLLAPFVSIGHPGALWTVIAFLVRWALVASLLLLVVGLLVRHAPATEQTLPWVSLGAVLVITSWGVVSGAFYLYLTEIASYDSVFGSLGAVIVAMGYLYISTTAFLFGAQLDAIIRSQATGALSGTAPTRTSPSPPRIAQSPSSGR
jgi:membrane protein